MGRIWCASIHSPLMSLTSFCDVAVTSEAPTRPQSPETSLVEPPLTTPPLATPPQLPVPTQQSETSPEGPQPTKRTRSKAGGAGKTTAGVVEGGAVGGERVKCSGRAKKQA